MLFLDIFHIITGIFIVFCAVLAFLGPEQNQILFPVIFCLAALLHGVNGWFRIHEEGSGKKIRNGGILQCLVALILFLTGIVSAFSIWR